MRFAALVAGAMLAMGIAFAATTPAFAASCTGAGCVHQDPQTTGCATGASNLAAVRPIGGGPAVSLRWSSACRVNWARFDDSGQPGYWTYWAETSDGRREYKRFNQSYWTWMVNGNLAARACVSNGVGQVACTGWY